MIYDTGEKSYYGKREWQDESVKNEEDCLVFDVKCELMTFYDILYRNEMQFGCLPVSVHTQKRRLAWLTMLPDEWIVEW